MTDCEIPAENLLPGAEGLRGPFSCLNQARYGIGWGAIGAAMACYQTALDYAKTRRQFANKPIASHQLVQEKLAWMITEISKAQLLALHVGRLKDQGRVDHTHISMLKMNNVWMARETARMARDILGANGIVDDYCVMRHMNNLESVYTYEGTHDIHKLVIGERITGILVLLSEAGNDGVMAALRKNGGVAPLPPPMGPRRDAANEGASAACASSATR